MNLRYCSVERGLYHYSPGRSPKNAHSSPLEASPSKNLSKAGEHLFNEPSEVEHEYGTSEDEEFIDIEYSERYRSSESMVVSASGGNRINTIKEMKTHRNAQPEKVTFEQPKLAFQNNDSSVILTPRETIPPLSKKKKKSGKNTQNEYRRKPRVEHEKEQILNVQIKHENETSPFKKSRNVKNSQDQIVSTQSDQVPKQEFHKGEYSNLDRYQAEQSWGKPPQFKKKEMRDLQSQDEEYLGEDNMQEKNNKLIKSKKIGENFGDMTNPGMNEKDSLNDQANQQTSHFNTNPTPKPASMQDIHNDHVLISQLTEAQQRIQEQDSLIVTLRSDIKQLQDLLEQKDNQFKSLHTQKVAEATEMNKFYQDRLKAERMAGASETPRIQTENQMIREQVRMLLDDAKERTHDIGRLKKLIGMYELQKEEFEHKFTLMRNKEIKLEAELDQAAEKYKAEEAKNRQLKMDYDELKFQMQRSRIFKDIDTPNFRSPKELYDDVNDFHPRREYSPVNYNCPAPIAPKVVPNYDNSCHNETRADDQIDSQNLFDDVLFRKNMKSSVGDLLRWDSTKGVYSNLPSKPQVHPQNPRNMNGSPTRPHPVNYSPRNY
ncbi:unnamed protein product [Moneuplotes crassus]|uniref:Uncharacterized protein n=1 Tax=Euplotes crassus TaxID=5936 RepID=A0AAD1XA70_EUPCR|nr:unnamed protein product [Moneuplotes crassus]